MKNPLALMRSKRPTQRMPKNISQSGALWMSLCLLSLPASSQVVASDLSASTGSNAEQWGHVLSPSGYTGAINTPTAHVQPWGVANLSWANSNPEYARTSSQGSFGSINAGIGLLPGLEAVGRLSYAGDLNCNQYKPGCAGSTRDLSLSAKYQLPLDLGPNTRAAIGVSDFGGAATLFRQTYGVVTTSWKDAQFSLGYSHPSSAQALLQGTFGSVRYALTPRWHLLAEHDTQENRAGLQYQYPIDDRSSLLAGYSRKWTHNTGQEANQMQLAWVFHMDRTQPRPHKVHSQTIASAEASSVALTSSSSASATAPQLLTAAQPQVMPRASANDVAQALQLVGFANVQVQYLPASATRTGMWQITAEPRSYRQSQIEALGHAMTPWLDMVRLNKIPGSDQLQLTLTYQRQPVLYALAQGDCLNQWSQGAPCQAGHTPLTISRTPITEGLAALPAEAAVSDASVSEAAQLQSAQASAGPSWAPQVTLSPALRNTLGTEYGLLDYSLAAQLGTEIALAPGLFWQGVYVVPVSNSDDYRPGKAFSEWGYNKSQWQSSQLTYWKPLPAGLAAQVSAGQLAPGQTGAQWDALWMSGDGRTRLGVTGGRYRSDLMLRDQLPLYVQARYSLIPGAWHAEVTGGQFMNGDRGFKIASVHWAGDTRLALQFQKTGATNEPSMPTRSILSFNVSFPFGPKTATAVGPVWFRAQDQWSWGMQTKVGAHDNYLTTGYAEMPRQRQGLWSDVTDYDRNGAADLQAQMPRLRALLQHGSP
jgi:Exopolysaccharide biosynthesis protein YbjH